MSGTRKRQGVTLVELSLVIAILAMIALPFAAFVSQNLRNTVQSSTQLKEQLVLEQVMQDMEKHLRSAVRTPSLIDISTPNRIDFYSVDPKAGASNLPTQTRYAYSLAGGLLTKTVGTSASATFPDGLEAGPPTLHATLPCC
jgi:prepilin-type N-terminal cleavage/methylation domain-containing protein